MSLTILFNQPASADGLVYDPTTGLLRYGADGELMSGCCCPVNYDCGTACTEGTVPGTVLASVSSVDMCPNCNSCPGVFRFRVNSPAIFTASQCLTYGGTLGGTGCYWEADVPAGLLLDADFQPDNNSLCLFVTEKYDRLAWRLERYYFGGSYNWKLYVSAYSAAEPVITIVDCPVLIFEGVSTTGTLDPDCSISRTITNGYVADCVYGVNGGGSATITPGAC